MCYAYDVIAKKYCVHTKSRRGTKNGGCCEIRNKESHQSMRAPQDVTYLLFGHALIMDMKTGRALIMDMTNIVLKRKIGPPDSLHNEQ